MIFPERTPSNCPSPLLQEVVDHVEGRSDLRALTEARQGRGWELARPERRVVHESTRKWGNVDTEDVRETSRVQVGVASGRAAAGKGLARDAAAGDAGVLCKGRFAASWRRGASAALEGKGNWIPRSLCTVPFSLRILYL